MLDHIRRRDKHNLYNTFQPNCKAQVSQMLVKTALKYFERREQKQFFSEPRDSDQITSYKKLPKYFVNFKEAQDDWTNVV